MIYKVDTAPPILFLPILRSQMLFGLSKVLASQENKTPRPNFTPERLFFDKSKQMKIIPKVFRLIDEKLLE